MLVNPYLQDSKKLHLPRKLLLSPRATIQNPGPPPSDLNSLRMIIMFIDNDIQLQ